MAYDHTLAHRTRAALLAHAPANEKKMFGGLAFMVNGNMAMGVLGEQLIVRVGLEKYEYALSRPGADLFQTTGRPMAGWVTVAPQGYETDEDLRAWTALALDFVKTLPAK
ncbi:MAG: TfoX/Sxy family protein [Chloroflexota bacterium]